MEIRTQRLLGVCFAIGCLTMLGLKILVPSLGLGGVLLGTLGGAAVGYLAYDMRQTWRGLIYATKSVFPVVIMIVPVILYEIGKGLIRFFAKPRPFFYLNSLMATLALCKLTRFLSTHPTKESALVPIWALVAFSALSWFVSWTVFMVLLREMGQREKLCDTWRRLSGETTDPFGMDGHQHGGNPFLAMSWKGCGWYFALLFGSIIRRFTWDIAVLVVRGIVIAIVCVAQIPRFVRVFLGYVHSDARLACAVDGPLGAVMAYVGLRLNLGQDFFQTTPVRQLAYILLGGLVSLGLGLASAHMLKSRVADPNTASI